MERDLFKKVSVCEDNPKWEQSTVRVSPIYRKEYDIRSQFARDYTRILHSSAYRRLKHKTQVFFATRNDHICTRIEHVNHVASVSYTIASFLGLNIELTNAIAVGHDLGHAPFGHTGEEILSTIAAKELGQPFWHERNSLRFVDHCETLPDNDGVEHNLDLTYAVRDGIICHCGEVDENSIFPREEMVDLAAIKTKGQILPFTWEGCVVKVADKISYLGRDIEDARMLKILTDSQTQELISIGHKFGITKVNEITNTLLMHDFIIDLCRHSSPAEGIAFSPQYLDLINQLKAFNYTYIYRHERLNNYTRYAKLVVDSIYQTLLACYCGEKTQAELERSREIYPTLVKTFGDWLSKYSDAGRREQKDGKYQNEVLYHLGNRQAYIQAIVDYISGMTDHFAIKVFDEITTF